MNDIVTESRNYGFCCMTKHSLLDGLYIDIKHCCSDCFSFKQIHILRNVSELSKIAETGKSLIVIELMIGNLKMSFHDRNLKVPVKLNVYVGIDDFIFKFSRVGEVSKSKVFKASIRFENNLNECAEILSVVGKMIKNSGLRRVINGETVLCSVRHNKNCEILQDCRIALSSVIRRESRKFSCSCLKGGSSFEECFNKLLNHNFERF